MSYKSCFIYGAAQIVLGVLLLLCCFIVEPLWLIIWDVVFGVGDLILGIRNLMIGAKQLKEAKHERNR